MDLVTIVTPVFNSSKFLHETIDSVLNQTHSNFEMICVDDISTDSSVQIINEYSSIDSRIKLIQLHTKGGASIARNSAIKQASGKYIAFLDADDIWHPEKLEKQIKFMKENLYSFTYTNFSMIDDKSNILGYAQSEEIVNYKSLLKRNSIGCLTVMYNKEDVGLVQIERIDKRNDYALWLNILKKVSYGYCLTETLSSYRISENSLSNKSHKLNLLKYHFYLFNRVEGFGVIKSLYYTVINGWNYLNKTRRNS